MKIITILKKSFVKDAKLSLKRDNDFFFSPLLYWIFSFFGSIPKKTNAFIGLLKPNHNNRFNFNAIGVLTLVLFFGGQVSWGQVNISSGNTVSQNFNTIGATATATLPTGWKVDAQSASRTFGTYSAAGTATVQTIGPAMSATATSGIYNYGSGTNNTGNDRAIGGLSASSSNRTINLYVDLLNNGASTIGSYSISYNIEKYRTGTLGMTIQMYYSTDGSTWTTAGVNFSTSPTVDGSVAAGPATVPISSTSVTSQLLSVTTTASSHLYLMWSYSATTGTSGSNAQALGIDDITISAASSSVNPTFNTYSNVTKIYGDGAFDMTASSNSSGTIAYSSSNTGVASINSSTGAVTITGVGSTTITASQAAATGYNAGSTTATLTVSKGNSSITATGTSTYIYNGTAQGPASNTKSGSTGAVTYSYSGTDSTTYAASATAPTAVGTYQVIATVAADSNYNTASSSALAFSITKGNSSITATGTSTYIYNGTAQGPASNTKSGSTGAVTYSYSETGSTTYAASATAPTAVGTYQVIATVAEDANYNSASSSPLAFSISQKALTITGLTAEDKIYDESTTATISGTATLNGVVGSEDVTLTGSPTATFASSAVGVGISVAVTGYSLTGADVANYTLTQPTLSASIISNTPTLFASGTLAAVNATYGSASATPSSFSVSAQSLTNAISVTAPTGFEVSLSSASDYAASVTFGAAGNVSSTNVYVRLTATNAIGSYSGNIEISSTDATTLTVATASSTVSQKQLTISGLTGVDKTYNNSTDASVSGTAELIGIVGSEDVSLNSSAATYAFANANVGTNKSITVLGYALNGTASSNYTLAQPSGITASINKADQTISAIAESQTISFGDAPYSVATTATSGLTVAYSSSNTSVATVATNGLVTIVGAGTATITASQSGNSNYNAATPVTQVVTVAQANQTITAITSSVTKTYGDATYSVATTATSGLTVTYSSDNTAVATVDSNGLVTIIGVGIANITAAQDGNTNYSAAVSVSQELTVSKASQTITFNALTNKTTADSAFNLTLNASSGLPITYTSSNTAVATISGNTVTILSSGSTTITASQDGNAFYDAATSVSQVQTILTPIVKWSFDSIVLATAASASPNITTGSSIADIGVQPTGSVFSANHASAATLWTTPAGNGTTKSATSDHWAVGDYYQFKVNTSNYRDLALSFDSTGSATGPNAFKVQYSLTGTGTFTDLPNGGYAITADSWSTSTSKTASNKSFDLSALTTLNNKSAIYIRLTCNSTTGISSTFGTGGTNRVDNLTITGVACDTSSTITTGGETSFCSGGSVTLTASSGSSYLWSNGATTQSISATNSANYSVTVTSANGCSANSESVAVTVTPNVTPTFSSVAAICTEGNLSALPTISNNSIEGTWSPALDNTTTTEYTFTPTAGQCATAATLTITVNPIVTPTFSSVSAICSGASLTALPTTSNNSIEGTWSPALVNTATTEYTFTPTAGQCATTATLTITVNNNLAVSVAIASSATDNTICAGTSVTFTASPVHGGEAPTYQWKKNGENVEGATSATYQTNSLLDTDKVTVVMTSNETGCHSTLEATSNEIETTVNNNLAVSVAIASSATDNTICAGTSVTFTASPVHGGEAPTYQWKKNDSVVDGETTASYTTNSLLDTDKVTVVMTSNETGCHSTLEATSNEIETTVNDNLAVSVAITSDATDNTICAGTSVIFTAAPTNGGDAPTYQWKINGADVDGATEDTFTPTNISNGQIVSVVMTSSEASSCLTSPTASSNNITFIVKPVLEIATQPVPTNICISSGTATISVIATGASTSGLSYEWQVKSSADNSSWTTISNDSVYNNSNTANLTITNEEGSLALDGNLYKVIITDLSDAACVATLTSDEIALTVNALPVAGAVFGKYGEICPGTSKTLSNYNGRGSIQWQESLDNSTYNPIPDVNTYLYTSQYSQNKYIRVVRSSGACPNAITNPYIVGVSSTTVAGTISGGDITICSGENFALTLTNSSGNVQWQQAIVTNGVPGNYTDTSYTDVTFSNAYSASTAQSVRLVRAKVSVGGGCSTTEYTDPVTITILKSVAGSISGSGSICEGDSKLLTLGTHVGSVQWQSFDGATWNDIAQANGNSYSAKPSITTSYRVKVTSGSCTPAYSKAVIVNVNSQINAGTITEGDFSVCSGVSSFINLQDNTSNAISWYKSVNGDASTPVWTKIINTTTLTLITNDGTTLKTGNLTVSTWYKATMTNGTCSASTPVIKATVTPVAKAGTITTNTTSVCLGSDITFTLNNNVGSTIQWQSAPIASGTFNDITDATSSSYTLTNATATSNKSYKAIVTSSNENGVCSTASVVKTITVNPLPVGGNVIGGGTVCSGSSSTLKISGSVGTIQWEYSTTGDDNSYQPVPVGVDSAASTFTSNSSTRTSTTYLIKNITDTTYFRARLTSGVCTVAYSNEVHYTVGDALAGDLLAAESTVCSANGGTNLTLGASTGIVAWYKSTNYVNTAGTSAVWTLVPLSSTVTSTALATGNLTYYAATPKIWYKAVATAGSCSSTSNIVSVTISRSAVATAVTGNAGATTLAKAVCSGVKTLSLATGSVGTIQWQFYNAGTSTTSVTNSTSVSWTDIDSATATTLSVVSSDAGNIWFRAKLTNSPCATSAYSTPVNVWIKACGSSVRVDDSAIEFKASAYPNPFAENFRLDVKTSSEEALQIKVYDMLGKLVDNKILETSEVEGLEIGSNYTTGVYNVIVTQGDNVKSLRVIKR